MTSDAQDFAEGFRAQSPKPSEFGMVIFCLLSLFNTSFGQEAEPQIFGDRSFRIPGIDAKLIVATDSVALVSDLRGNVTVFDIDDGTVASEFSAQLEGDDYISGSAHTRDGRLFALTYGRNVEIRSIANPAKILLAFTLPMDAGESSFYTPTLDIAFSWDSSAIYVYDDVCRKCTVVDLATGDKRKMFDVERRFEFSSGWNDQLWFVSSESLVLADPHQILRRFPAKDRHWFMSVQSTEFAVYTVCHAPSGFLSDANVLFERDPKTFAVRNRWTCDSHSIAIVEDRPVFYADGALFLGEADGTRTKLATHPYPLFHLRASTTEQKLTADLAGGIRVWNTDTWEPHEQNEMPSQLDTLFAVNDEGRLRILTARHHAESVADGKLGPMSPLPSSMTRYTSHRSLSADGERLAFIDDEMSVNYIQLGRANSTSRQLKIPNNGRPKQVVVSDSGQRIAVTYHPDIRADDPDGARKVTQRAFQGGVSGGLFSRIFGTSKLTETCAIFELPATTPQTVGVIGRNAPNTTAAQSPYLASTSDLVCWVGDREIGRWDFGKKNSRPKIRSTPGEGNHGFCAFSDSGDIMFQRHRPGEQVRFQVFWDAPSGPRPELIVEEVDHEQLDHSVVFALSQEGRRLYLADSRGNKSTVSVIQLPGKERLSEFSLPARVLNLRLSPNRKFLGAKLSDSRYAVISVD